MPLQIALLRAINVGGRNKMPMAELKSLCLELGLSQPQTYLQTGNLLFEADWDEALKVKFLEGLEAQFGFCPTVVFDHAGLLGQTITDNPFGEISQNAPNHLLVYFLDRVPTAGNIESLQAGIMIMGGEKIVLVEDRLYVSYHPNGIGRSKLTVGVIEKYLGVEATGRNWNTILKLQELIQNR
ncbi:DUF1697 domain-containing protein [Kiloniella antarctica]|uniref:DUF1697 domain-containing protein n=1 Tax=Kiloniella antarctica TaxID=1550907 RepID=A0ABW5BIX0_9PROT